MNLVFVLLQIGLGLFVISAPSHNSCERYESKKLFAEFFRHLPCQTANEFNVALSAGNSDEEVGMVVLDRNSINFDAEFLSVFLN